LRIGMLPNLTAAPERALSRYDQAPVYVACLHQATSALQLLHESVRERRRVAHRARTDVRIQRLGDVLPAKRLVAALLEESVNYALMGDAYLLGVCHDSPV
jgi:hypothetical protein